MVPPYTAESLPHVLHALLAPSGVALLGLSVLVSAFMFLFGFTIGRTFAERKDDELGPREHGVILFRRREDR